MTYIIKVVKIVLNIIYLPFKLLKTKKQITLISRLSNTKTTDFKLLEEELIKELPDYKIVVLCKTMDNKLAYIFHMIKQMYHISRSRVVILDSYCILVSMLKHKKDLKVIQIWHALGLLKKAGYAILDKEEGRNKEIAIASNMHKNYDYILTSSKDCINSISEVFNYDKNKVHSVPLPRIDLIKSTKYIDETRNKILKKYKELNKKINILYAPTFRKNEKVLQEKLNELCAAIDYDKYNLIVKLHPLSKIEIDNKNVINDKEFSTTDMMTVAEYVISDYSSIIYEAGIMNKKLIFYAFDLDSYSVNRSFFIDYNKELPGPVIKEAKEIINFITNGDYSNYNNDLITKYVDCNIDNYTNNMVKFIKKILSKEKRNDKWNMAY